MKKNIIYGIILIVISLSFSACTGTEGTPQSVKPEKVANNNSEKTVDKKKEVKLFQVGEDIKLGDYVISINNVENPYVEKNQYSKPGEGNKFIAVEVSYQNNTSDKTISYNPFDWKLFDGEGYNYESSWTASKKPDLSSGDINPGSKVRGWITFEVPIKSENFKIKFTPGFWDNANVEIKL